MNFGMQMERAGQSGCWAGLGSSLSRSLLQQGDGAVSGALLHALVPHGFVFPESPCRRGLSTSRSCEKSLEPVRSDFSKKNLSPFCSLSVTAPVAAGFTGRTQVGREVCGGCTSLWPPEGSICDRTVWVGNHSSVCQREDFISIWFFPKRFR